MARLPDYLFDARTPAQVFAAVKRHLGRKPDCTELRAWVNQILGPAYHIDETVMAKCRPPKRGRVARACAPPGKLPTRERDRMPNNGFALPSSRKYPLYRWEGGRIIPSRTHAQNAKARAKQSLDSGHLTRAQYQTIIRKANLVLAKCGGHAPKKKAKGDALTRALKGKR